MRCGEFHTTYASDMGIFETRRARFASILLGAGAKLHNGITGLAAR